MERLIRTLGDIVIFLMLVGVLGTSVLLFYGAYCQHSNGVSLNLMVLREVQQDTSKLLEQQKTVQKEGHAATNHDQRASVAGEIQQLKDAQNELFDRNSVSFQYQLIQIVMVVVGIGILRYIQSTDKQRQEVVEAAKRACTNLQESTFKVELAINNSTILAMQSIRLHSLSILYPQLDEVRQDRARAMMRDFIGDISHRLKRALATGGGFEEEFYLRMTVDSVGRFLRNVRESGSTATEKYEIDALKLIWELSSDLLDNMEENADEFIQRYNTQWGLATRNANRAP
jgi:hypothetical protein